MKKFLLIAAVLLSSVAANAQVNFGLKGGLNITDMRFDQKVIETTNQAGFFVGPTVKFTLPVVGLGVDVAALYNQRTLNIDGNDEDANIVEKTVKHQSISIPANIRYQVVGLGDLAGIFIYTGPQVDFNIGDKTLIDQEYMNWTLRSSDFSWNVGFGAMIADHLQVNANYNIGISKTSEAKFDFDTIKTAYDSKENTWQIGLAYYF